MQIYDIANNFKTSFDVHDDAYIERALNKLDILFFRIPKGLGYSIQEEGYIEIPEGRFVVKEKKVSGKYYDIVGKPDIEVFQGEYIPNYTYTTQSFKSIMDQLLAGTGWTCVCTGVANRTLTGKTKTKWEIIQHALEVFKYEVRYDIKNKIIYADTLLGSDRGAYFHHEINLRELTVSSDTYDFCTKLIPIGKNDMTIEEVNGGLNYVVPTVPVHGKTIVKVWTDERYTVKANLMADAQEKVDIFSKPYKSYEADVIDLARLKPLTYNHLSYQVGDTITLVDRENKTTEKQRVIGKKEYLRDRLKDKVTIANRPKSITETSIKKISEDITVVKQYIDVLEGEIKLKASEENYSALESRMSEAEVKITDSAIVNTVTNSTKYTTDINSKESAFIKSGTMPPIEPYGKIWIDTSKLPNVFYRSDGTNWIKSTPTTAGEVGAYSATDGGKLANRVSEAESKITAEAITNTVRTSSLYISDLEEKEGSIVKQATAPVHAFGKLWLDTSRIPNILYRSNGTDWLKITPTTAAEVGAYSATAGATLFTEVSTVKQTTSELTAKFETQHIGTSNLLANSARLFSNALDNTARYTLEEELQEGEEVAISFKGYLGADRNRFAIYNTYTNTNSFLTTITNDDKGSDGVFRKKFTWVKGTSPNTELAIYALESTGTTVSRIEWANLVRGNVPPFDWVASEKELYTGITKTDRDGIEVGISTSPITTRTSYDGLRIINNEIGRPTAYFTNDGADINKLFADRVYSPHVLNKLKYTKNVYVAPIATGDKTGRDDQNKADSVMTALATALDGAKYLDDNAQINVNISQAINEDVFIHGIGGFGAINLIGAYGATKITGSIQVRDTTVRVNMSGITVVAIDTNAAIALVHATGPCMLDCTSMRIDGANQKKGFGAYYGALIRVKTSPIVNCTVAFDVSAFGQIFVHDTYGQNNAVVSSAQDMGMIGTYYRRPNGTTAKQEANGGKVEDLGAPTGSSFSYTPPAWATVSKTFRGVLRTENYGTGYVWRTGIWTQGSYDGTHQQGIAEFGTQISDFLNGSGGYQGLTNIIIRARRNTTSGVTEVVACKVGLPTTVATAGATRGSTVTGSAAALASALAAGSLTLKSTTSASSEYAVFDMIEISFDVQKRV